MPRIEEYQKQNQKLPLDPIHKKRKSRDKSRRPFVKQNHGSTAEESGDSEGHQLKQLVIAKPKADIMLPYDEEAQDEGTQEQDVHHGVRRADDAEPVRGQ